MSGGVDSGGERAVVCSFIINWPIFQRAAQAIDSLGCQQLFEKVPVRGAPAQLKSLLYKNYNPYCV